MQGEAPTPTIDTATLFRGKERDSATRADTNERSAPGSMRARAETEAPNSFTTSIRAVANNTDLPVVVVLTITEVLALIELVLALGELTPEVGRASPRTSPLSDSLMWSNV